MCGLLSRVCLCLVRAPGQGSLTLTLLHWCALQIVPAPEAKDAGTHVQNLVSGPFPEPAAFSPEAPHSGQCLACLLLRPVPWPIPWPKQFEFQDTLALE